MKKNSRKICKLSGRFLDTYKNFNNNMTIKKQIRIDSLKYKRIKIININYKIHI